MDDTTKKIRLQKYLADCGMGSRRACEEIIENGHVRLNGAVVERQGVKVGPGDQVRVEGKRVAPQKSVYMLLNKPRGVLCTSKDTHDRQTFVDCIPAISERIYCVGRLDKESEGLLIITNDGDWAHRLMHPRHHVEKRYRVWTENAVSPEHVVEMRKGVMSDGELLRAVHVKSRKAGKTGHLCEVVLREGRKRQIRRMFSILGYSVKRLCRIATGPLRLGKLRPGEWRHLRPGEVAMLRDVSEIGN